MSLRARILTLMDSDDSWLTAQVVTKRLKAQLSSVGSLLLKLSSDDGPVEREPGHGPRGGYGYRLKTRKSFKVTIGSYWLDTQLKHRVKVLRYESKGRCYRVQAEKIGMRLWAAAEEFGRGRRYIPATSRWDMLGTLDG